MPRKYHPLSYIISLCTTFSPSRFYSDKHIMRRHAHYKRVAKGPGVRERMRIARRIRHTLESTLKNPALRGTKWTTERYGIDWASVPQKLPA